MEVPDREYLEDTAIAFDRRIFAVLEIAHNLRRKPIRALQNLANEAGLTERRLMILEAIHRGINRPARLVDIFEVLPSTITFETQKLAAAGFLVRETPPSGGRTIQLNLTEAGIAILEDMIQIINQLMTPSIEAITAKELETFLSIGELLISSMGDTNN